MCKKCSNPKSAHLKALDDPFIVDNPHFTAEVDTMPDGIHAKPRHMWKKVYENRSVAWDYANRRTAELAEDIKAEYDRLPEPKPNYLEWAAKRGEPHLFEELLRQALTGKSDMTRVRAIGTLLEFTKSKPKQELELTRGVGTGEIPELFRQLSQLAGIPIEATEAFLASYVGKPSSTN